MNLNLLKYRFTKFLSLLFLMMLIFPYIYMGIKVVFIVILVMIYLMSKLRSTLEMRYQKWIGLYFLMNLLYYIYGLIIGNPGIQYYLLVFLFWPILYYIFCSLISEESLFILIGGLKISFFIITSVGVIAFLQLNGFIPSFLNLDFWDIGSGDRPLFVFQAIKSGSTVSFIFLFPFFYTMLLIDKKFSDKLVNRLMFFLSLIYIFATTRRAIMFSILYLPVIIFIFSRIANLKSNDLSKEITVKRLLYISIIPICILLILGVSTKLIDLSLFSDLFSASFNSDDNSLGADRDEQFFALIDGWLHSPLFGVGPGIDASVSRSELPGSYELTYVALLFSRGVFGFLIYVAQFVVLIIWGIKLSKIESSYRNVIISYNVAFVSFLISNGSNPYLDAYDHMWILYLYIALQSFIYKFLKRENEKNLCVN